MPELPDNGYPAEVLVRFDHPAAVVPAAVPAEAIRAQAGSAESGCCVEFTVVPAGAHIGAAYFRAWGCPYTVAAADKVCEQAAGEPLAAFRVDAHALAAALDVPTDRLGRLLVIEDAWAACMAAAGA